jgi:hypothetical protein
VVEGARLEIVCALTGTAGSNPALSVSRAFHAISSAQRRTGSLGSERRRW